MRRLWFKEINKGVSMTKKKKVEVKEEPVVVAKETIEVQEPTVLEGAAVVEENLNVDPNDPRTRSDR